MKLARPLASILALALTAAAPRPSTAATHWHDFYHRGLVEFRSASYGAAADLLQQAIVQDPVDDADKHVEGNLFIEYLPHYYRAVSLLRLGRVDEAQRDFEEACEYDVPKYLFAPLDKYRDELLTSASRTNTPRSVVVSRAIRAIDEAVATTDYERAEALLKELRSSDFTEYARHRLGRRRRTVVRDLARLRELRTRQELVARRTRLLAEGRDLEAEDAYQARLKYAEAEDIGGPGARKALKSLDQRTTEKRLQRIAEAIRLDQQGSHSAAVRAILDAQKSEPMSALLSYNLAVAYGHNREFTKAVEQIEGAISLLEPGPSRDALQEFRSALVTNMQAAAIPAEAAAAVNALNRSVRDSNTSFARVESDERVGREPCEPLESLTARPLLEAGIPSLTYNRARCAELNDDLSGAVRLLTQYLSEAGTPTDAPQILDRIALLQSLLSLPPSQSTAAVRRLYVDTERYLDKRRLDLALKALHKAAELMPDFAETTFRLASYYEFLGNVVEAHKHYQRLITLDQRTQRRLVAAQRDAQLQSRLASYEALVADAEQVLALAIAECFDANHKVRRYRLESHLGRAATYLNEARSMFPLAARVNELLAIVFTVTGQHELARQSFDVLWSQRLPISFFASDGSRVILSPKGTAVVPRQF